MTRENYAGRCEACGQAFQWHLIHNDFNSSCHAYCSLCGTTAILSHYSPALTSANSCSGGITTDVEPLLAPCACGGSFQANANPRCPSCSTELSPVEASKCIEPPLPGSQKGWHWQRIWTGPGALYAIIINDCWVRDPFLAKS